MIRSFVRSFVLSFLNKVLVDKLMKMNFFFFFTFSPCPKIVHTVGDCELRETETETERKSGGTKIIIHHPAEEEEEEEEEPILYYTILITFH